ncbi:MAG: hypothetical protein ACXVRA_11175 [Gaiellaceae bacterium]
MRPALAAAAVGVLLVFAAPATASTTLNYHCGSATISELSHVAHQCVFFDACGPNCELRTITFADGSSLVIHESIVGAIFPGESSAAGANAPQFLEITQTIVGGTGRFVGATGSGTGRVNLAANAVITASGTITL